MSEAVTRAIDAWVTHPLPKRNGPLAGAEQRYGSTSGSSNSSHGALANDGVPANNGQGNILSPGMLHEILIRGYLKPGADSGDVPPLQIRRTLDHYFYSHLESTSRRDGDQVVQRYTSEFINVEPKMFMVDQLWLWVLDDGKCADCRGFPDAKLCLRYGNQLLSAALGLLGINARHSTQLYRSGNVGQLRPA